MPNVIRGGTSLEHTGSAVNEGGRPDTVDSDWEEDVEDLLKWTENIGETERGNTMDDW
jgi:hypothetical protein